MQDLLLDFLFPRGFALMIVIVFAMTMLGAVSGFIMKKSIDDNESSALLWLFILICGGLLGAIICYHFMWHMICRQFACG